jgi:hypothetical protein
MIVKLLLRRRNPFSNGKISNRELLLYYPGLERFWKGQAEFN